MDKQDKHPQNSKKPKPYNSYLKYSGLGIQMAVTIYLGHQLGLYLDDHFEISSGLWSKIITMVAVFLSTFVIIRQVIKSSSDN